MFITEYLCHKYSPFSSSTCICTTLAMLTTYAAAYLRNIRTCTQPAVATWRRYAAVEWPCGQEDSIDIAVYTNITSGKDVCILYMNRLLKLYRMCGLGQFNPLIPLSSHNMYFCVHIISCFTILVHTTSNICTYTIDPMFII